MDIVEILPDVDPAVSMAIWAIVLVIRGLIPANIIDIDGKQIIWTMVLLATVIVLAGRGEYNEINDVQTAANAVLTTLIIAAGAILTDGAAKRSGLSDTLRIPATLDGHTNTP